MPASDRDTSPSDKVHILRAGCLEAFPPHRKVKASPAAAKIGVSQILVKVETGTRADDLIHLTISTTCWQETLRATHICV